MSVAALQDDGVRYGRRPILLLVPEQIVPERLSHKEAASVLAAFTHGDGHDETVLERVLGARRVLALCSDVTWDRVVVVAGVGQEALADDMLEERTLSDDEVTAAALRLRTSTPRQTQTALNAVYGRLELERALAWTMEELGEYAQAARRNESPERLSEELGQVTAWVYCLGNITGVDIGAALQAAVHAEVARQHAAHGGLRPYGGGR